MSKPRKKKKTLDDPESNTQSKTTPSLSKNMFISDYIEINFLSDKGKSTKLRTYFCYFLFDGAYMVFFKNSNRDSLPKLVIPFCQIVSFEDFYQTDPSKILVEYKVNQSSNRVVLRILNKNNIDNWIETFTNLHLESEDVDIYSLHHLKYSDIEFRYLLVQEIEESQDFAKKRDKLLQSIFDTNALGLNENYIRLSHSYSKGIDENGFYFIAMCKSSIEKLQDSRPSTKGNKELTKTKINNIDKKDRLVGVFLDKIQTDFESISLSSINCLFRENVHHWIQDNTIYLFGKERTRNMSPMINAKRQVLIPLLVN